MCCFVCIYAHASKWPLGSLRALLVFGWLRLHPYSTLKLTPKQREQLARPRPVLFTIIIGTICLPWGLLFGANVYLQQQQPQLDAQSASFFDQTPVHHTNLAARRFDELGAQLGLGPNATYQNPIFVDTAAAQSFQTIETSLSQFLEAQSNKISGPLDPLPPELQQFFQAYQPIIDQLQSYLLTGAIPQWEMDIEQMADTSYQAPGFFNVRSVHKLLLISAVQAHSQNNLQQALDALEASWLLNQAIVQRSDLSSQISVSVISAQQAGLLRHISNVPPHWQPRLIALSQQQPVIKGVRFEAWLRYEIAKSGWIPILVPAETASMGERLQASIANSFSLQAYFKLLTVNRTRTAHKALVQLTESTICDRSQTDMEAHLTNIRTAKWNGDTAISPVITAKRWQTAGDRTLALELSQYVLEIKQKLAKDGQWPSTYPSKPSQVCPGEHWHYQQTDSGILLSFSKQLLSPTAIPLIYRSRSVSL